MPTANYAGPELPCGENNPPNRDGSAQDRPSRSAISRIVEGLVLEPGSGSVRAGRMTTLAAVRVGVAADMLERFGCGGIPGAR
jgi:hypothetical protein